MTIQLLFLPGCPNHKPALQLLMELLAEQGLEADVHEVVVGDLAIAESLCFPGSPTIRINGRDVEAGAGPERGYALACRIYSGEGGLPKRAVIRKALQQAAKSSGEN